MDTSAAQHYAMSILSRKTICGILLASTLLWLSLSACQTITSASAVSLAEAAPVLQTPEGFPLEESIPNPETPQPTSSPVVDATESLALQGPTPTTDALRFVFPTPGSAVRSAWRPPLYEVPWALGAFDHFFFTRPIAADEVNWPLWDYRYGGIFEDTDIIHTGIDIDAPMSTPVLAAGPGKVVWTGYGLFYGSPNPKDPYGLAVAIRHDFGYQGQRLYTVYAHLSEIFAYTGQKVATGDTLGLVGDTGKTTGPHLHFEVRVESNDFFDTRNPELWLAPPQGWGVLAGRVMDTNGKLLPHKEVRVTSVDTGTYWTVRSYGQAAVNSDPFYQENLVLSDLPAGKYRVRVDFNARLYDQEIEIYPGQVSYFTFRGKFLFSTKPPPTPVPEQFLTPIP